MPTYCTKQTTHKFKRKGIKMNDKPRGVAHEYWIERRRARLQARRRVGGPYRSQGFCQEKKIKKYEKNI